MAFYRFLFDFIAAGLSAVLLGGSYILEGDALESFQSSSGLFTVIKVAASILSTVFDALEEYAISLLDIITILSATIFI